MILRDRSLSKRKDHHLPSPKSCFYYVSDIYRNYSNQNSSIYSHIEASFSYIKFFQNLKIMKVYEKELLKKKLQLE